MRGPLISHINGTDADTIVVEHFPAGSTEEFLTVTISNELEIFFRPPELSLKLRDALVAYWEKRDADSVVYLSNLPADPDWEATK